MSVTRLNQQRVDFYVGVLDDLLDIIDRIENCSNNNVIRDTSIPVVAKVEMTGFNVQIGMEYFIYINTYGIPLDGVFDETLLQKIRDGLPIPSSSLCGGCQKTVCVCKPVTSCPTETDTSGCPVQDDSDSDSDCHTESHACNSCHYVVCCCNSGCGNCGATGTSGTGSGTGSGSGSGSGSDSGSGTGTGTTTNGTTRIDNDTAGGGDLGIVIVE